MSQRNSLCCENVTNLGIKLGITTNIQKHNTTIPKSIKQYNWSFERNYFGQKPSFWDNNYNVFIVFRKPNPKVWEMVFFLELRIPISMEFIEVFDQNNSFHLSNYCLMDFNIFVLFFCILAVIPFFIHRFVTFTQKKTNSSFYHSKSDNCGSAAVNFWTYLWAEMAPATHAVI